MAVLLLWLWPALGGAMEPPSPDGESPPPASFATWRYLTRLEATGLALLPNSGVGGAERYAQLTPMLVVDGGEAFGLNLGAPVLGVALNGRALGLGQPGARHLNSGQVRWRFGHKLSALAEGGTLLHPKPDGTLRPGAYASLGLGVDNAR
ncbi:hypothetical protein DAT35_42845 [Vitiosangium sp. GDMCC 1.1324]|nr:hypothetical protein DAT35_42845 [Vitiosangium sp. GDMCC 1.1324]